MPERLGSHLVLLYVRDLFAVLHHAIKQACATEPYPLGICAVSGEAGIARARGARSPADPIGHERAPDSRVAGTRRFHPGTGTNSCGCAAFGPGVGVPMAWSCRSAAEARRPGMTTPKPVALTPGSNAL